MKFEHIKDESPERFRRLTGIKRTTFDVMITILTKAEAVLIVEGGKPNKLSGEDRLLMKLEYLRESRTYFHISRSYRIIESACYRIGKKKNRALSSDRVLIENVIDMVKRFKIIADSFALVKILCLITCRFQ